MSISLPTAVITYTLGFLDPSDLPCVAEVSQAWRNVTISRIRSCAVAAVRAFEEFLRKHVEPKVSDCFFTRYTIEQFREASCSFAHCNSLKQIQLVAEEIRRQVEEELFAEFECQEIPDQQVEELDQLQNTFNYGFEKIFFLLKMRRNLKNIHPGSHSQVLAGIHQIMRTLTARHCGIRALEMMNEHPVLLESKCQSDYVLMASERERAFLALALGFVDRGDFPAAFWLVDHFPVCLGRDIERSALSDDFFERARNKMKEKIFMAISVKKIVEKRYDEAKALFFNIHDLRWLRHTKRMLTIISALKPV